MRSLQTSMTIIVLLAVLALSACVAAVSSGPEPTATSIPLPTATAQPSPTPTSFPSPSVTPLPLPTMTVMPSPTASSTATVTPAPVSIRSAASSRAAAPVPGIVVRGDTSNPWVCFTFDLGADPGATAEVLDILRDNQIQSTFFVTGQWAEANPELLKRIVAEGHRMSNHSYSHPDFTTIGDDEIASQLSRTEEIVQDIAGVSTLPYFRPPYGAYDNRVLRAVDRAGYTAIYWTIDGTDWRDDSTADSVLHWVMKNVEPGAIIIHHAAPAKTAQALPQEIQQIREKGLQIVNLPEMLGE